MSETKKSMEEKNEELAKTLEREGDIEGATILRGDKKKEGDKNPKKPLIFLSHNDYFLTPPNTVYKNYIDKGWVKVEKPKNKT